jgi:hypothetical protein
VTIKIDKNYVLGAGGTLENPTEVKGYTAASNVKADRMVSNMEMDSQKYSGFCLGGRQRLFC